MLMLSRERERERGHPVMEDTSKADVDWETLAKKIWFYFN